MTQNEIEQWMDFYYQNPQPEYTKLVIESLSKERTLLDAHSAEPFMFFLSFIFRLHPDKVVEWISPYITNLSKRGKEVLVTSLWLSDTRNAKDYLNVLAASTPEIKEYVNDLTSESLPNLENISIDHPSVLDILWAAFMATGEKKHVIRIISALAYLDSEGDELKQLVGNSAKWSLKSNIKKGPEVKSICVAQLSRVPSNIVPILQDIID